MRISDWSSDVCSSDLREVMMTQPAYMDPAKTKYLTIHCAATPEGRDVKAATISQWDIQKFGQVSYQLVVELDGSYHRTLHASPRGAHVGGHNSGKIGICYVAGVAKEGKTPKEKTTATQKKKQR